MTQTCSETGWWITHNIISSDSYRTKAFFSCTSLNHSCISFGSSFLPIPEESKAWKNEESSRRPVCHTQIRHGQTHRQCNDSQAGMSLIREWRNRERKEWVRSKGADPGSSLTGQFTEDGVEVRFLILKAHLRAIKTTDYTSGAFFSSQGWAYSLNSCISFTEKSGIVSILCFYPRTRGRTQKGRFTGCK